MFLFSIENYLESNTPITMKFLIAFLFCAVIAFVAADEPTADELSADDVKILEWVAKIPAFKNIVKILKDSGIDISKFNGNSLKLRAQVLEKLRTRQSTDAPVAPAPFTPPELPIHF